MILRHSGAEILDRGPEMDTERLAALLQLVEPQQADEYLRAVMREDFIDLDLGVPAGSAMARRIRDG
jgi:hypothetical protein